MIFVFYVFGVGGEGDWEGDEDEDGDVDEDGDGDEDGEVVATTHVSMVHLLVMKL